MTRIFDGLRVIDAGSFIAAPAAATVFADFGADVIKLEPPVTGDPWRNQFKRPGAPSTDNNFLWTLSGRNKRSLAVDLKTPEGVAILDALVATADVFITNMPFAVRGRLSIDAARLCAINPRLVYASFSSFGERGPEKDRPGFDGTVWWTRSGLCYQLRHGADGEPLRPISGFGDNMSGVALFAAASAALYRRERIGRGGEVGTSLLATGAWTNGTTIQAALGGASIADPLLRDQVPNPLQCYYRTADNRWIFLNAPFSPAGDEWLKVVAALSHPELLADPRFSTVEARAGNRPELLGVLEAIFAERTAADWYACLDAARVPCEILVSVNEAAKDPQMRAAGVIVPTDHDDVAETVSTPLWLGGETKVTPSRPPELGEHNAEILSELGLGSYNRPLK